MRSWLPWLSLRDSEKDCRRCIPPDDSPPRIVRMNRTAVQFTLPYNVSGHVGPRRIPQQRQGDGKAFHGSRPQRPITTRSRNKKKPVPGIPSTGQFRQLITECRVYAPAQPSTVQNGFPKTFRTALQTRLVVLEQRGYSGCESEHHRWTHQTHR